MMYDYIEQQSRYEIVMKSADYKPNMEPENDGQIITYELRKIEE